MLQGKKSSFSLNPLKIIVWIFEIFFQNQDEKEQTPETKSSALTQERAKTVDEKDDKTGYEVVIRVITT